MWSAADKFKLVSMACELCVSCYRLCLIKRISLQYLSKNKLLTHTTKVDAIYRSSSQKLPVCRRSDLKAQRLVHEALTFCEPCCEPSRTLRSPGDGPPLWPHGSKRNVEMQRSVFNAPHGWNNFPENCSHVKSHIRQRVEVVMRHWAKPFSKTVCWSELHRHAAVL